MAPYYIMMRLPGEKQTEFFLMLPMAPSQRENMIAWLAARCDPPDYGKLIVYEFPKEKLVYGPFQIEARINQNTEISQQISLWNQMGSRVIRGNLLVVPIENSILYVIAALSARGVGPVAGAQARDRGLWRPRGHGGDAALRRWPHCSRNPPRWRPCPAPPRLRLRARRTNKPGRRLHTTTARSSG